MEQLNGGELFDRIEEVRDFGEAAAADLISQVVDGVRYLHEQRKLCHRDLKPENLVFKSRASDSDLKLIDFGMSAYLAGGPTAAQNTQLKTQCGTAGYQAPEVLRGEEYGFAADMFSVGVIAYMLLTGSPPFYDSPRRPSIDVQIVKGLVSYDAPWCQHLSDQALDFLQKLLHPDSSKRLKASQVMSHPWMKKRSSQLAEDEKVEKFDEAYHHRFKETNAALKKKLQGAAWGVVAAISFAQAGAFKSSGSVAPIQECWESQSTSSESSLPESIPS
jgi:serine/threonine protein kinase